MATLVLPRNPITTTGRTNYTYGQQSQQPSASKRQRYTSPQRKHSNPTVRGSISENTIAIGTIVYLAPKDSNKERCRCVLPNCDRKDLADQGYDHPAVVLRILDKRPTGGEIMAYCCTMSANPQPIRDESPSKFRLANRNVPEPDINIPNDETIIYLEQDSTMYKQSYIYDHHVYAIPISQLSSFNGSQAFQNRLTYASYSILMYHLNIALGKWELTADLVSGKRDPAIAPQLLVGAPKTRHQITCSVARPRNTQPTTPTNELTSHELITTLRLLQRAMRKLDSSFLRPSNR